MKPFSLGLRLDPQLLRQLGDTVLIGKQCPCPVAVQSQATDERFDLYVENARWQTSGYVFATLHLVGGWNGLADFSGRTAANDDAALERTAAAVAWLIQTFEVAREVEVELAAPEPILLGRHLIAEGHRPGPAMGAILDAAFEAQLDGCFDDLEGALQWLRKHHG